MSGYHYRPLEEPPTRAEADYWGEIDARAPHAWDPTLASATVADPFAPDDDPGTAECDACGQDVPVAAAEDHRCPQDDGADHARDVRTGR